MASLSTHSDEPAGRYDYRRKNPDFFPVERAQPIIEELIEEAGDIETLARETGVAARILFRWRSGESRNVNRWSFDRLLSKAGASHLWHTRLADVWTDLDDVPAPGDIAIDGTLF
jgi:hypothetical protein